MKTTLITLTLSITLFGCIDKSDESNQQEKSIYGQWNLIKYEPGFSPTEHFNRGQITWTFHSDYSLSVIIENDTKINDGIPLNTSGKYTYTINDNELLFDNNLNFEYKVVNNELILSSLIGLEADGKRITFLKVAE